MKKLLVFSFFILILTFAIFSNIKSKQFCYAAETFKFKIENKDYQIEYENQNFENLSKIRNEIINLSTEQKIKIIKKIKSMGFDKKTILNYIFPNIDSLINEIAENVYKTPINAGVKSIKNCKIDYFYDKNGVKIDKNLIYNAIFNYVVNNKIITVSTDVIFPEVKYSDIYGKYFVCGKYSTYFNKENLERSQNIQTAADAIDGIVIKPGEIFSFNVCTGVRSEEKGYKAAKIISNGKYVEGFGGGVCQVSSTLYNAALLSGLDITEVHGHSIKSAYIEPGFDAMVNFGSADLKIKNNLDRDVLITSCVNGGECKVCIYATEQKYKIKTRNEIIEEEILENKIKTVSYLDYFDNDVLIKTKKIRENTYLTQATTND